MKNPSEHIVRDLSHTFEMTNDVILTIARRKNLYPSISEASLSNDKNPSVYEKSPAKCYYSRRILSFRTAGR